jgi:anti-sigma regulatory factor (Ser/Thr protein kinase)
MIACVADDGTKPRGVAGELRHDHPPHAEGYSHEAFFYDGSDQFMDGVLSFVTCALAAREPILVVLSEPKLAALRARLDGDSANVLFADMGGVGLNPARIIPAWHGFIDACGGRGQRLWGIGEPIWAGRSAAALVECQRHEALLNIAFPDVPFSLLCPYDLSLAPTVLERSRRDHPFVRAGAELTRTAEYVPEDSHAAPVDDPLPDPPPGADTLLFSIDNLGDVRALAADVAAMAGLSAGPSADLMLALNEICANSVTHGGGHGTLRLWSEAGTVVCEVSDSGRIDDPLAGRRRPHHEAERGRGLWLANQLCDLTQVRNFSDGCVVRLHMAGGYAGSA